MIRPPESEQSVSGDQLSRSRASVAWARNARRLPASETAKPSKSNPPAVSVKRRGCPTAKVRVNFLNKRYAYLLFIRCTGARGPGKVWTVS